MNAIFKTLGMVAALTLAGTAYAEDGPNSKTTFEAKDNGGYEVESKADITTPAGTVKTGMHADDVDVDDDGSVSRTIETKSSTDPEGLMNKSSKSTETTYEKDREGNIDAETVTRKRDADGTNVTTEVETDVSVDEDGNAKKTTEKTKTVDPKGLMNKRTTTTKTVNGKVVSE